MAFLIKDQLRAELDTLRSQGLYKEERVIVSPQGARIGVIYPAPDQPREVLNFCANNYLGLANHPAIVEAAHRALQERGYGLSSVRFICGTQDIHVQLERKLSEFLGTEATILYNSCFDANGGLFEALLTDQDAVFSDALNHASIIDGIRLCKAKRYVYRHLDMDHLRELLEGAKDARRKLIATDGVFSMDGDIAPLAEICDLADKYGAMVMVDDSHATGVLGATGRGTHEELGVVDRIDVITTTLGKALGGATGGCASGRQEIVDVLRQRSRPYLFSNSLPPVIVGAALTAIDLIGQAQELRDRLRANTQRFREGIQQIGYTIKPGSHPIVPVMLYNAALAQKVARDLYELGIYVIGFFYPVVPRGEARIRVQLSAAHEPEHIERALDAFKQVGEKYGILGKTRDEIVAQYGE